jgi:hypothetical protein
MLVWLTKSWVKERRVRWFLGEDKTCMIADVCRWRLLVLGEVKNVFFFFLLFKNYIILNGFAGNIRNLIPVINYLFILSGF